MTPTLVTSPFFETSGNETHFRTHWQIVRSADGFRVFDVSSETCLTALTIPKYILKQETLYSCSVRFIGDLGAASPRSDPLTFETPVDERDSDSDGIPDDQAVDENLDYNPDGGADDFQPDAVKCAYSEPSGGVIAIEIDDPKSGAWISALQIDPPEAASNSLAESDPFPFGVILSRVEVPRPGGEVGLTVRLPRAAPPEVGWHGVRAIRR